MRFQAALAILFLPLFAAAPPEMKRPVRFGYSVPADIPAAPTLERWLECYAADKRNLERFYDGPWSAQQAEVFSAFYRAWLDALGKVDFNGLSQDGKVDYLLFSNHLNVQLQQLALDGKRQAEIAVLVPFGQTIAGLYEARQRTDPMDPEKAAASLKSVIGQVNSLEKNAPVAGIKKAAANRASTTIDGLRESLCKWNSFYAGYDPQFTWWTAEPYKRADAALKSYSALVREKLAGASKEDKKTIFGDPIGRDALIAELASELIPYTPEELIEIANREFAWCTEEMKKASRELGYGDDWHKALEYVKTLHVPPGKQPDLVRDLALEAIDYVETNDLVTVPELAKASWRMGMMSPEKQKFNPFFLGGESILVSYPTDGMTQDEKMMAMRGNNIHFSRATVFHELIPGHNLQFYMTARYRPDRRPLATPFWTEGWALYWEMLLWDQGFPRGPEDRVGMLFWRMHRCARIIFSLSFHLEKMTPAECVQFLIERGGQEPDNAEAEVRRSFEGGYSPLYQIAYMIGALQFRALQSELVGSGRMTMREYHDRVLRLANIPVEMVRASLIGQPLTRDFRSTWRFYPGLR